MVPAYRSFIHLVNIFKYLLWARNGLGAADTALIKVDMDSDLMKLIS